MTPSGTAEKDVLHPHLLSAGEALRAFGADAGTGLTEAEAARRLAEAGPNALLRAAGASAWKILLRQFANVIIAILLVAIVLSLILGQTIEALAIGAISLFTVALGFIQEYRADRALDALRRMAAPNANVLRDGEARAIPARDVVPGDIVVLGAGDIVPADARLVEAVNLKTDESSLTGESAPVEKRADAACGEGAALGDRPNMVHASTAVTYGRGRAVVTATGPRTEVGKIGSLLGTVESPRTPLELQLDRLGALLVRASLVIVAAVAAFGILRGQPPMQMLLFGIAFAVAVVPEALPAVVTISLAIGARLMAKRNALVRHLPAVETLGCTTVICADKTGTLTAGEMTVREVFAGGLLLEVTGVGYEPRGTFLRDGVPVAPVEPLSSLLAAAALCSDADVVRDAENARWRVIGDPTEGALVVAAAKGGFRKPALDASCPRTGEIPFSPERKRMTTLHAVHGATLACSKGAPEILLASCTRWRTVHGDLPLSPPDRAEIARQAREMADRALRVLAVARREGASGAAAERNMTFLGLFGMIDPPRAEARSSVEECHRAGIRPVMITGDHPATARAVAREIGLPRNGRAVTGPELDAMSDEALEKEIASVDVFARVSPAHKLRIVSTFQKLGQIVAMTGDGVNDAPALKKADIGVAMGITGTDVAKEAAAMTLTDDDFASIVAAVREGRAIFENIRKYLMYLLSSNLGEIGLIAATMIAGLPLPLTAVQILYVNLATDGLPALALAVDPRDPDVMRRPPRRPGTGILTRRALCLMGLCGFWTTTSTLGVYWWALRSGRAASEAVTMTFVTLVIIQFFNAYVFRSERRPIHREPFTNRWLNLAVAWEALLLAAIVHVPVLRAPFGTFALTAFDWFVVVAGAFSVIPVMEAGKRILRNADPSA